MTDEQVYAGVEKALRKYFGKRGEQVVQDNLTLRQARLQRDEGDPARRDSCVMIIASGMRRVVATSTHPTVGERAQSRHSAADTSDTS